MSTQGVCCYRLRSQWKEHRSKNSTIEEKGKPLLTDIQSDKVHQVKPFKSRMEGVILPQS